MFEIHVYHHLADAPPGPVAFAAAPGPEAVGAGGPLPPGVDLKGLDPATIALILKLLETFGPMVAEWVKRIIARRRQQ